MDKLDNPQVYLPDVWAEHAHHNAEKMAVVCEDDGITWGEFNAGLNRVANTLLNAGYGKGDKIAVVMGNSIDVLMVMFGVVKSGACVVPLSSMLSGDQICHLVNDSGSVMVFADQVTWQVIEAGREKLENIRSDGFVVRGGDQEGWQSLDHFLAGASEAEPGVNYDMEDEFNIIYSSGTTGLPKGIVQTHRARHHWSYSNAIEMRFDQNARALTTTALYSNGTWLMVLPLLFVGGTLHIMKQFSSTGFLETVQSEGITHSFMVPTQYIAVLNDPALVGANMSSLKVLLSAGSPMRADTKRGVQKYMSPNLYELYGFTEGFATMLKPEAAALKPDSVGVTVLGFEAKIIDDDGHVLPVGEVGEIAGTGAGLMKGYHNRPKETADIIWRDRRGRSFVRSGDIGRMDEDGFVYILDRKKDMIISGGFNVFPADLEQIIAEHPAVADVTVIGIPHEKWGETPLALIIRKQGSVADAEEIKCWSNERLAKTQRLAGVEFRDDFPRNALGKVLKRELRAPYWAKVSK